MCGLFDLDQKINLGEVFRAQSPEGWPTGIFRPTAQVPMVFVDPDADADEDERQIRAAQWWLAPAWSKELRSKYPTFNARSETAATKPTFRDSVKRARCLIPASGYYETQKRADGSTRFRIHPDDGVMAFAGLYSEWREPGASRDDASAIHLTTTILTRSGEGALADIHDRMPIMVPPQDWDAWLDPATMGDQGMLEAYAAAGLPVAAALRAEPDPASGPRPGTGTGSAGGRGAAPLRAAPTQPPLF